jgi:hypothetical protein
LSKESKEKSALRREGGQEAGQTSDHFIGGSILLSKGGSVQMSVKGIPPHQKNKILDVLKVVFLPF